MVKGTLKAFKKTIARVRKDLKVKPKARKSVARRDATIVLAQGAMAPPRKNFGTKPAPKKAGVGSLVKCLDARVPRTLGLPRAVGPYTVIRTTKLLKTNSSFVMLAPFAIESTGSAGHAWRNWCGITGVDPALPVSDPGNTVPVVMPMQELGNACEVVPAALTVQVMNPAPLQTASGVYAMSRINQQLSLGGSTASYADMTGRILSFYSPRLLTGGKLSLRGVKCSSYPLDMSEYSHFAPINSTTDAAFEWANTRIAPAALAPIVIVQDNPLPQFLEYMVTIEWRVRFDPGNPATASHTHHDTLSDEAWNSVTRVMSSVGHGVEELSEDALEAGAMAYGAVRAAGALAPLL